MHINQRFTSVQALVFILFVSTLARPAQSNSLTVDGQTTVGWRTTSKVFGHGTPGDVVTLTLSDNSQIHTTVQPDGTWEIHGASGKGSISSVDCPTEMDVKLSSLLRPPDNYAVASHTVLSGSTIEAENSTFNLTGGYTLNATAFDFNPSSPSFGNLSGVILASGFNIFGSGLLGTIGLSLAGDQPFTVSMLPVLTASDPVGSSITFNIPISGTATFNTLTSPFSGFASGTSTYGIDGAEAYSYALNLTSNFGSITGSVHSFGTAQLVPESSASTIIGICIFGLFVIQRKKCLLFQQRGTRSQETSS